MQAISSGAESESGKSAGWQSLDPINVLVDCKGLQSVKWITSSVDTLCKAVVKL